MVATDDQEKFLADDPPYELFGGLLVVSPGPTKKHQAVSAGLFRVIDAACPPQLLTLFGPLEWRPDQRTSLRPDLLVIKNENPEEKSVTEPLTLAVEVLSSASRRKDLILKRSKYEEVGVASYWIVDPEEPSVVALDLVDGRYQVAGQASGADKLELELPFPITVIPSALLAPSGV